MGYASGVPNTGYAVARYTTATAVQQNGTFTVPYPSGVLANHILPYDQHFAFIESLADSVSSISTTEQNSSGFSVTIAPSFTAVTQVSGVLITWLKATTIPANSLIVFQFAIFDNKNSSFRFSSLAADVNSVIVSPFYVQTTIKPPFASSAIITTIRGEGIVPPGPGDTAGGHCVSVLGYLKNDNTTSSMPLLIGIEGKIDNSAGATITTAISTDNNIGFNAGTINAWYGSYSYMGSNTGTISTAVGYGQDIANNAGIVTNYYGFYFPALTSQNVTGTILGFFFNNNPNTTALKFAIYVADPNAPIYTVGAITSAGRTATANFQLDAGIKTATAAAGAVTLDKASGKITTEALVTAAAAAYTLTLTNSQIAAADTVYASINNGTNNAGRPLIGRVTPAAGSVVIVVENTHASAALNGTLIISFMSLKA